MANDHETKPAKCKHSFLHLETTQEHKTSGYGSYHRIDIYYCTKCLELVAKEQSYHCPSSLYSRNAPPWFTGITKN